MLPISYPHFYIAKKCYHPSHVYNQIWSHQFRASWLCWHQCPDHNHLSMFLTNGNEQPYCLPPLTVAQCVWTLHLHRSLQVILSHTVLFLSHLEYAFTYAVMKATTLSQQCLSCNGANDNYWNQTYSPCFQFYPQYYPLKPTSRNLANFYGIRKCPFTSYLRRLNCFRC